MREYAFICPYKDIELYDTEQKKRWFSRSFIINHMRRKHEQNYYLLQDSELQELWTPIELKKNRTLDWKR